MFPDTSVTYVPGLYPEGTLTVSPTLMRVKSMLLSIFVALAIGCANDDTGDTVVTARPAVSHYTTTGVVPEGIPVLVRNGLPSAILVPGCQSPELGSIANLVIERADGTVWAPYLRATPCDTLMPNIRPALAPDGEVDVGTVLVPPAAGTYRYTFVYSLAISPTRLEFVSSTPITVSVP